MTWRVVFGTDPDSTHRIDPLQLVVDLGTGPGQRKAAADAFGTMMHEALVRGGCRSFTVTVHPDGPDCDHEVTGGRHAA